MAKRAHGRSEIQELKAKLAEGGEGAVREDEWSAGSRRGLALGV